MKSFGAWFKALSRAGKVITVFGAFSVLAIAANTAANQQDAPNITTVHTQVKSPDKVETKTVIETKPVPYDTETEHNSSLNRGTTVTTTKGTDGVETLTYLVTYINEKETNRFIKSDVITIRPINKVVVEGTKVPAPDCPNGTYVNSAGNTVCSPYQSSSAPVGATAQCVDRSYSFSQSRSGTCSHHGGVMAWL